MNYDTGYEIGRWVGGLLGVSVMMGLAAVFNAQPKDRTFKTFIEYAFAAMVCSLIILGLFRLWAHLQWKD